MFSKTKVTRLHSSHKLVEFFFFLRKTLAPKEKEIFKTTKHWKNISVAYIDMQLINDINIKYGKTTVTNNRSYYNVTIRHQKG
jgi:hypothetical protein